ncbi:ATP-binding cassette domain-containing protein [Oerskovia sp. M15]
MLAFQDVTARYLPGGEPVVRDLTFEVPRRGQVAIVGPSGAGKTTTFSLLLRFLQPESGTLLLDGRPYADYTFDEVRARIAYVEQETPVVPGPSARTCGCPTRTRPRRPCGRRSPRCGSTPRSARSRTVSTPRSSGPRSRWGTPARGPGSCGAARTRGAAPRRGDRAGRWAHRGRGARRDRGPVP